MNCITDNVSNNVKYQWQFYFKEQSVFSDTWIKFYINRYNIINYI